LLPRVCYATAKWTGWFPLMYVGKRQPTFYDTEYGRAELRIVSADYLIVARLKNNRDWKRLNR